MGNAGRTNPHQGAGKPGCLCAVCQQKTKSTNRAGFSTKFLSRITPLLHVPKPDSLWGGFSGLLLALLRIEPRFGGGKLPCGTKECVYQV